MPADKMVVTFVCSGNTCRSPMAESIARRLAREKGVADRFVFYSAGVSANSGSPPAANAQAVLSEMGYSTENLRSKSIHDIPLEESDIVFTFEVWHRRSLLNLFPSLKGKVFTLGSLLNASTNLLRDRHGNLDDLKRMLAQFPDDDIPDPLGKDLTDYRETAEKIETAVSSMIDFLAGDENR